ETNIPLSIQVWEQGARANNGVRAGQFGDRRAVSIPSADVFQSSCLNRPNPDTTYEFQLKRAGCTPFSWSADGVAVRHSSIREYLCSEAMHVLGIPTTRSPEMPVTRERLEKACVMARVAETFILICNSGALSPSRTVSFLGIEQRYIA
ncbi:hypothetical protein BKA83DRAFT_12643, partial [Pisolithus microcarpus]